MKNYAEHSQTQIAATKENAPEATVLSSEVDLFVEELEQVIAPASGVRK
jgi:hypothetical protein